MEMNTREMERYERVYRQDMRASCYDDPLPSLSLKKNSHIEANIEEAKQQIIQYKKELQNARVIRRHRQEYDALAKVYFQIYCVWKLVCVFVR